MNRRGFIKQGISAGVAAAVFPSIVPSTVLGGNGAIAPSDKITVGCIGTGWQGTSNLEGFLRESACQIVAVCDLDDEHLHHAKDLVNKSYNNSDCATTKEYREVLERNDIDAVSLGLPDHWHAIPAIEAARAGKDIYGEKPLSHSLLEGRAICDAVQRYNRIWQTGSWQRSQSNFRIGAELVLNGRIGKLRHVEVGLPSGHADFAGTRGQDDVTSPPAGFDYNKWVGPAEWFPYVKSCVHKNWRWRLEFGGGQIMDWVGHHVDIAHWGMGCDYTGPIEIDGKGEYPDNGVWNTAGKYWVETKYANGVTMVMAGGYPEIRSGTKWIGDNGWIFVTRNGVLETSDESLKREVIEPDEIHLYNSTNHIGNFLDCIKTRKPTITPCEVAHRSASPGHLGQISMLLGRKLKFNPDTEEIIGDETASRMLGNNMRAPWHL